MHYKRFYRAGLYKKNAHSCLSGRDYKGWVGAEARGRPPPPYAKKTAAFYCYGL